jgi:hypothetical protein
MRRRSEPSVRNPVPDHLHEILDILRHDRGRAVGDFIPQLADVDPDVLRSTNCRRKAKTTHTVRRTR